MSKTSKSLSVGNIEERFFFMYRILSFLETILEICFLETFITECSIQLISER